MIDPRNLLSEFGFAESEIDTYLALLKGATSAREVINLTGRSRPTAYYALQALERRGLVLRTGKIDDGKYEAAPLSRLSQLLDERAEKLDDMRYGLQEFIRQHETRPQTDRKPQIAFYEGSQAVRNVIMETLYSRRRHIDSLVPSDNFFWQLGEEFVEHYVEMRHTLKISTRNLWGRSVGRDILERYYEHAQVKMLPDGLGDQFRTTIFMYDQSVLYISSLASGYCLVVDSAEHSEMMHAIYENLWQQSKQLT